MFLLFCPHSTHHPNSHELAVDVSLKWTFVCCWLLSSVLLCYCQIVIYCDAWCCHRSWTMLLTFWRMDRVSGKIRASVKLSVLLWRIQTSSTSSIGSRMGVLNRLWTSQFLSQGSRCLPTFSNILWSFRYFERGSAISGDLAGLQDGVSIRNGKIFQKTCDEISTNECKWIQMIHHLSDAMPVEFLEGGGFFVS